MKNLLSLSFLLCLLSPAVAQDEAIAAFDRAQKKIDKTGMLVLGGWSVANIVTGAIGTNSDDRQTKYFSQMNVTWNAFNLLIAAAGYYSASKESKSDLTLQEVIRHQNKKEKIFLLNAGLDVAYITGGLYLTERSRRNEDPAKLKGFGNAIMLQGGFLLLFDAVMYSLHRRGGKALENLTGNLTLLASPAGLAVAYRF